MAWSPGPIPGGRPVGEVVVEDPRFLWRPADRPDEQVVYLPLEVLGVLTIASLPLGSLATHRQILSLDNPRIQSKGEGKPGRTRMSGAGEPSRY